MNVDRLTITPATNKLTIQYLDEAKRPNSVTVDVKDNATVAALVAEAQQQIPAPADRPDKAEIQKEISQLEARIVRLKQSIGEAIS